MKGFYALANHCHLDDLAYVTGVLLGDGCVYKSHQGQRHPVTGKPTYTYSIELKAKDQSFVLNFAERLSHIIHRPDQRKVTVFRVHQKEGTYWRTCRRRKSFGDWWLSLSAAELEQVALAYPADFLCGIYDSEGSLSRSKSKSWIKEIRIFTVSPTTRDIIQSSLQMLNLTAHTKVTRHRAAKTKGPNGPLTATTDMYCISPAPYRRFFELVQSSIPRKNP